VRVVVDSNVYISALISGGRPLLLIEALVQDPNCGIFYSGAILGEVTRILKDKFRWPLEDLHDAEKLVMSSGTKVTPGLPLDVVPDDPDDNRILECAIEAGANCVVTGDKDLLRLGSYGAIRIVQVAELIDLIRGEKG
jgi:putative PIN family toxin of toxin-antitoxin system